MSRTALFAIAAAAILVSGIGVVFTGTHNRRAATGGQLELSESELGLPPVIGDSTALFLNLLWRAEGAPADNPHLPGWLDIQKLTELGFDCSVPLSSPNARAHYGSLGSIPVYLVLHLEPVAPQPSGPASKPHRRRENASRLVAVDAGRDPAELRQRYSDSTQYAITRALVRVWYQQRGESGDPLPEPRLKAWIETLLPSQVFVPNPGSQLLQPLRQRFDEADQVKPHAAPRFAATVSWGTQFEPWLVDVRLTKPALP